MTRIGEFEALRGFLALWVVVGHVLMHGGYPPNSLGVFAVFGTPGLAVDVFIMLSGFVIFDLLDTKHEGYGPFIVRRLFRIFPLYVFTLIIGALLASTMLAWINAFPWRTTFIDGTAAIAQSSSQYLTTHFLVHLTGLHGLVSDKILPYSEYGIVGQAWSISVEWQFYLLAPLLYFALTKKPTMLILIMFAFIAIHSRYWLGEGFIMNQAQYFLTGIICYFVYKHLPRISGSHLILGAVTAIAASAWFTPRPVSLCIWIMFFASALYSKQGGRNPISHITSMQWAQFSGRISYSIYLLHMFVILLISNALLRYFPEAGQLTHISVLMPLSVFGTVILAWLSFNFIEKPGMDIGRVVAKRISLRRALPDFEANPGS